MLYQFHICIFLAVFLQGSFIGGKRLEKRMHSWERGWEGLINPAWKEQNGYNAAAYKCDADSPSTDLKEYPRRLYSELNQSKSEELLGVFDEVGRILYNLSSVAGENHQEYLDLRIIRTDTEELMGNYVKAALQVIPESDAASNMEPMLFELSNFYGRKLAPLLARHLLEPRYFNEEVKKQEGEAHLAILKEILISERGGDSLPQEEFDLVKNVLSAIRLLCQYKFITPEEVKDFFKDEGVIKTLGRHLVRCYDEQYPNLVNFKSFIPDMDFLRKDSKTNQYHWWLNLIDETTEGKILFRSMQKLFANMAPRRVLDGDMSSSKWAVFLDEGLYQGFEWKGSAVDPHKNQLACLKAYIEDISQDQSTTDSLEEVLSNYWIRNLIFRYNANSIGYALYESGRRDLLNQHDMTGKIIQIQTTRNRFFEENGWFDPNASPIRIHSAQKIVEFEQNKHKQTPNRYMNLKAEYESLLEKSVKITGFHHYGMRLILDRFNKDDPINLMNGWLNPIDHVIISPADKPGTSKLKKLKKTLKNLIGYQ